MAERFARGGRLIALGRSPTARSDARHVAVEFVHPVIVGKRALPALGADRRGRAAAGAGRAGRRARRHPDRVRARATRETARGARRLAIARGCRARSSSTRRGDPFVRQELVETAYHVLWELVHVFFEHRGLLEGRRAEPVHDSGASAFLYPFLGEQEARPRGGRRRRARVGAGEGGRDRGAARADADRATRPCCAPPPPRCAPRFAAGGRLLALGNGGSATDAMDVVADFHAPLGGGPPRPAIDLTEDAGDPDRARQRHRPRGDVRPPGDRARARPATCCWRSPPAATREA